MDSSSEISYPRLIRRVQALLIDSLFLPICVLSTIVAVSHFGITGAYAALSSGLVIFLLYPVLVSSTGGTIGHHLRGLRVIHPKSQKNLNVFSATLRFVLKVSLGWLSLITYFTTKRYQAIHDLASNSVVVLNKPLKEVAFEKREERKFHSPSYQYPSAWRKVIVVVAYNLFFVVFTLIGLGLIDRAAYRYSGVYFLEFRTGVSIFWQISVILFFGASIYYCRSGRIFGCKRKPIVMDPNK